MRQRDLQAARAFLLVRRLHQQDVVAGQHTRQTVERGGREDVRLQVEAAGVARY